MELVERGLALSREVPGGAWKASDPEQWPESAGRGLERWLLLTSPSVSDDKLGCCCLR